MGVWVALGEGSPSAAGSGCLSRGGSPGGKREPAEPGARRRAGGLGQPVSGAAEGRAASPGQQHRAEETGPWRGGRGGSRSPRDARRGLGASRAPRVPPAPQPGAARQKATETGRNPLRGAPASRPAQRRQRSVVRSLGGGRCPGAKGVPNPPSPGCRRCGAAAGTRCPAVLRGSGRESWRAWSVR